MLLRCLISSLFLALSWAVVVPVGRTGAVYMTTQDHPDYLPSSFDVSESGSPWPCYHDEGHVQYMCRASQIGQRDIEMSIDADRRNLAWLSRSANGLRLDELGSDERQVVEDYLNFARAPLIRGGSHGPALPLARDTLLTCKLLADHEHADDHSLLRKRFGFIHLIDIFSILSVLGLALAASAIGALLGGDKNSTPDIRSEEYHRRTRSLGRNSIHFRDIQEKRSE